MFVTFNRTEHNVGADGHTIKRILGVFGLSMRFETTEQKPLKHVVWWDSETGRASCIETDADGKKVIENHKLKTYLVENVVCRIITNPYPD